MGLTIGVGTAGMVYPVVAADADADNDYVATVATFAHDPVIFDSGAARGANAADIPLSGTTDAPNGHQIEARLVRADNGMQVAPWTAIATASGGAWAGSYPQASRSPYRLAAQVRATGTGAAPVASDDLMVGHVVVLIGQSEDARMFSSGFDNRTYQTIPAFADAAAEDSVFVLNNDGGTYESNGVLEVNPGSPVTASVAHLANVLTRNAPGEKFLFIEAAVSGTSYKDLADEEDLDRDWDTTFADAVAMVRDWGGDVGVVLSSWTAAPSASNDGYRQNLYPLISGRYAPDNPNNPGAVYTLGSDMGNGRNYDHLFWDLSGQDRAEAIFDPAVTKMAFHGPHRFEDSTGGPGIFVGQKQDTRVSIRNMVDDPELAAIMRPKGPEIIAYQNGTPSSTNGNKDYDPAGPFWSDWAHPSDYSDDGLPGRARHTAIAALYALGIGPAPAQRHDVPRFNRADWEPAGAYVDLWYEDATGATPAITTTRLARNEPAIPDTFAHRTEVAGFYINGNPAERAEIVAGRVRIYPDPAGAFDYNATIEYGLGGASGVVQFPEDELDDIWKNLPIAETGFEGVEGVALEPLPAPVDIANDLPAPVSFVTVDGSGPWFQDPGKTFAGTSGREASEITMLFKGQMTTPGTNVDIFGASGNIVDLEWLGTGGIRFFVEDSTGAVVLPGGNTTISSAPSQSLPVEIIMTADLANNEAKVFVNGVSETFALNPGTGVFASNRATRFLPSVPGATVERLALWREYCPTGNVGDLGTPHADITGGAAAANANPWKEGADAAP